VVALQVFGELGAGGATVGEASRPIVKRRHVRLLGGTIPSVCKANAPWPEAGVTGRTARLR
jgi:hypothetical protein